MRSVSPVAQGHMAHKVFYNKLATTSHRLRPAFSFEPTTKEVVMICAHFLLWDNPRGRLPFVDGFIAQEKNRCGCPSAELEGFAFGLGRRWFLAYLAARDLYPTDRTGD